MAKITITDYDAATVSEVEQTLQQDGHVVSIQTTSEGLMKSLRQARPDLVIIGVELDGSDGRELSRLLNTESKLKDIPVIITSPYFHSEADIRSYFCDELVSVPFERETLSTAVTALLQKAASKPKAVKAGDAALDHSTIV